MQLRKDIGVAYLGLLAISFSAMILPVPVFIHMIVASVLVIYIGAHNAILQSKDVENKEEVETMQRSDVYMFPIIGSCVLFGLYCIFKIFPRAVITLLVKVYFMLTGVYVVAKRIMQLLILCISDEQFRQLKANKRVISLKTANEKLRPIVIKYNEIAVSIEKVVAPVVAQLKPVYDKVSALLGEQQPEQPVAAVVKEKVSAAKDAAKDKVDAVAAAVSGADPNDLFPAALDIDGVMLIGFGSATVLAALYLVTNHWLLSNVFGICFSIQAIELLNLGSYMNGAILLGGLFFYDVFWVFGTDVMVTVAKNFDAPIKLIFPAAERPAMLGLGDIVIPGVFIALILRLDVALNRPFAALTTAAGSPRKAGRTPESAVVANIKHALNYVGNFSFIGVRTEYFNVVMIAYTLGLLTTVFVMVVFKAAQPALLYLVPACVGSTAGLAYFYGKNEFDKVINFTDEPDVKESDPVVAGVADVNAVKQTVNDKKDD